MRRHLPPDLVPSCQEAGVLGVIAGTIGVIQATEVIKLILGKGELLNGKLLLYDSLRMDFKKLKIQRNPDCPICSEKSYNKRTDRLRKNFCQVTFLINCANVHGASLNSTARMSYNPLNPP